MTVCDICGSKHATHSRPVHITSEKTQTMDLCYYCWDKLRKAEYSHMHKAYLDVVEEVTGKALEPASEVKKKWWWQK